MTCCGKKLHNHCAAGVWQSSMSFDLKNTCVMCRTKKVYAGTKEDIKRIRKWVKKGKPWAKAMLGNSYREGIGVSQSYERARYYYELAGQEPMAMTNLGILYENGLGVAQSYEKAKELYEIGVEHGEAGAQNNLAGLHYFGRGNSIIQNVCSSRKRTSNE